MSNKILFVGQAPSFGSRGDPPFTGICGRRLAYLMNKTQDQMLIDYDFVNVLDYWPGSDGGGDHFPMPIAKMAARKIADREFGLRTRVVLLGANVFRAFNFRQGSLAPLRWRELWYVCSPSDTDLKNPDLKIALCPHPSGVNRWWNDDANVEAARRFFTDFPFKATGVVLP